LSSQTRVVPYIPSRRRAFHGFAGVSEQANVAVQVTLVVSGKHTHGIKTSVAVNLSRTVSLVVFNCHAVEKIPRIRVDMSVREIDQGANPTWTIQARHERLVILSAPLEVQVSA
jgi:hypothetical protein